MGDYANTREETTRGGGGKSASCEAIFARIRVLAHSTNPEKIDEGLLVVHLCEIIETKMVDN